MKDVMFLVQEEREADHPFYIHLLLPDEVHEFNDSILHHDLT